MTSSSKILTWLKPFQMLSRSRDPRTKRTVSDKGQLITKFTGGPWIPKLGPFLVNRGRFGSFEASYFEVLRYFNGIVLNLIQLVKVEKLDLRNVNTPLPNYNTTCPRLGLVLSDRIYTIRTNKLRTTDRTKISDRYSYLTRSDHPWSMECQLTPSLLLVPN